MDTGTDQTATSKTSAHQQGTADTARGSHNNLPISSKKRGAGHGNGALSGDGGSSDTINVAGVERLASGLLGTVLVASGVQWRSVAGVLTALVGAGLLYRGVTGHCHVYQTLGVSSASDRDRGENRSHPELVRVQRTVTIRRPADELYRLWKDPHNLRAIMGHFAEVDVDADQNWHWGMRTPVGHAYQWTTRIVEERPGELLRWRSLEDGPLTNEGMLSLAPATDNRETRVTLALRFHPPGGPLGLAAANALRMIPATLARKALQRFKSLVETGEIATNEGPSARQSDRDDQALASISNVTQERVAGALGWFSVGLGLAELAAPRRLAAVIGVPNRPLLIRLLGVRELVSGIGILSQHRRTSWLWSRVAGDGMDLALLGAALRSPDAARGRVSAATAAVLGVTAVDALSTSWHQARRAAHGRRARQEGTPNAS
jgi:uncharacterized membrane protein